MSKAKSQNNKKQKTYYLAHWTEVVFVDDESPEEAIKQATELMGKKWFEEENVVMFDKKPVWAKIRTAEVVTPEISTLDSLFEEV